uniref:Uncharacterized protein n=1 Tax=Rousettus aegyptiacus TaxID=9407 RepID=A0A7J8HRQ2_ROUAE|nr:hypothetical protein HJG63_010890 [Rousettus aegyptiacus]
MQQQQQKSQTLKVVKLNVCISSSYFCPVTTNLFKETADVSRFLIHWTLETIHCLCAVSMLNTTSMNIVCMLLFLISVSIWIQRKGCRSIPKVETAFLLAKEGERSRRTQLYQNESKGDLT